MLNYSFKAKLRHEADSCPKNSNACPKITPHMPEFTAAKLQRQHVNQGRFKSWGNSLKKRPNWSFHTRMHKHEHLWLRGCTCSNGWRSSFYLDLFMVSSSGSCTERSRRDTHQHASLTHTHTATVLTEKPSNGASHADPNMLSNRIH